MPGPAVIGILLSLCSMLVVREVAPYENPSTNILANLAQLQLLATCELGARESVLRASFIPHCPGQTCSLTCSSPS